MKTILILLIMLTTITAHAKEPLEVKKYRVKVEFKSSTGADDGWMKSKYIYSIHQTGVLNSCNEKIEKMEEHTVVCDIPAIKKEGEDIVFLVWVKESKGFGPISKTKTIAKIIFPTTKTAYSDTSHGRFTVSFMELRL